MPLRKALGRAGVGRTEWARGLGALDLLGVAAVISLPTGVYLGVPETVRYLAGPSTVLSVLIATVLGLLTALHLSELVVAIPRSGPAYHLLYASCGELPALLFALVALLDYLLTAARLAAQLSAHARDLFGGAGEGEGWPRLNLSSGQEGSFMAQDFDVATVLLIATAFCFVLLSTRVPGTISLILAVICTLIVSSSVLVGFFYADTKNWLEAGFFRHGYLGMLRGAGHVSVALIGIEATLYLAEEVKYPEKRLPVLLPLLSLVLSTFFGLLALSITLALDSRQYADDVILPRVYAAISVPASRYVLSVGSVCGLSGALLAVLIPPTRILHSLATDGLLCGCLGRVYSRTGTPALACGTTALLVGALQLLNPSLWEDLPPLTLPLRMLVCVAGTAAQRWSARPVGLEPVVASYRTLDRRKQQRRSVVDLHGSTSIADDSGLSHGESSEDEASMTSSFICRNIAVLQMGSQSFLPGPAAQDPGLSENSGLLVSSVSR